MNRIRTFLLVSLVVIFIGNVFQNNIIVWKSWFYDIDKIEILKEKDDVIKITDEHMVDEMMKYFRKQFFYSVPGKNYNNKNECLIKFYINDEVICHIFYEVDSGLFFSTTYMRPLNKKIVNVVDKYAKY